MFLKIDRFCCYWETVHHKIIGCAQLKELVFRKGIINLIRKNAKSLKEFFV